MLKQPTADWKVHNGRAFKALDVIAREADDDVVIEGYFKGEDGGMSYHGHGSIRMSRQEYEELYGHPHKNPM